jgi:hypothetical protein
MHRTHLWRASHEDLRDKARVRPASIHPTYRLVINRCNKPSEVRRSLIFDALSWRCFELL